MKVYRVKLEQYDREGLLTFDETFEIVAPTMERAIRRAKVLARQDYKNGDGPIKSRTIGVDRAEEIVANLRT